AALNFYYENEPMSEPLATTSPINAVVPDAIPLTTVPELTTDADPVLSTAPGPIPTTRPPPSTNRFQNINACSTERASARAGKTSGSRRSARSSGARIATLGSISGNEPQELYAGGEKSGMAILPNLGDGDDDDGGSGDSPQSLMGQLLRRAAENASRQPQPPPSGSAARRRRGRVLGTKEEKASDNKDSDSEYIYESSEEEMESVTRNLTVWTNGFTIEGSDRFYSTDEPRNQAYIQQMLAGAAPAELFDVRHNQSVEVHINYQNQPYTPSKVKVRGKGQRLGSSADQPAGNTAAVGSSIPGAFPASSNQDNNAGPAAQPSQIKLDPTKPKTRLRIVLDNGASLQPEFNTTHTVGDVRQYIIDSHPAYAGHNIVIRGGFPLKTYDELDKTLEEVGLKNTKIIVKIE
ncbi:protein phosphatase regulator, partial [Spiromyces aspiralis]